MATMAEIFAQGYEIGQRIPQRERALQAAKEKYGAAAEDPELFAALEGERRAGEAHTQGMRLNETRETRAQQEHDFSMSTAQSGQQKEAVLGILNGLRQTRDRGGDLGAAFDSMRDTLIKLGVDVQDMPEMKKQLVENPAVLDEYMAMIAGPGSPNAAKMTDKERARTIMNSPNATQADKDWAAAVMKTGGKGETGGAVERAATDIFNRLDILEAPENEAAGRAVFGFPTPGKMMHGGFGAAGTVFGSSAADYAANLDALASDIRSAAFETLKGGGQITEKESEFAADAIAKISRSTSYEEYRRELGRLRAYITRLTDAAARREAGETVADITETPPSAAPSVKSKEEFDALPSGTVFVDPKGTLRRKP